MVALCNKSWRILRHILPLIFILSLAACGQKSEKQELYVSAAISLKDALTELAGQFEKSHPDSKIRYNFGASGQLAQQVLQGAPADLFVSASTVQIQQLSEKGLVTPDSVRDCAGNSLVLISAKPGRFNSMADLEKIDRLAIGDPKVVPAGAYARQALEKAKLYQALSSGGKLVLAEDARQVLAYVEGGDVDAGLVYNTDALLAEKSKVCFTVPQSYTKPVVYQIAILKNTKQQKLAGQFLDFVTSPESRSAFQRRGFAP
jgi:molybdate transport system substrate-binding protein